MRRNGTAINAARPHPAFVGWGLAVRVVRRCPALPPGLPGSTLGAGGLSFRVRNGSGRFPAAMAAATVSGLVSAPPPGGGVLRVFPRSGRGGPVNRVVDASLVVVLGTLGVWVG